MGYSAAMDYRHTSADLRTGEVLTPRQREILALVARGLSSPDIAAQLGISPGTVKAHLTAIYRTIGARNRVQATRYYLDHLAPQPDA
jgi:DNA-binding NarL/FixJ family response regulator